MTIKETKEIKKEILFKAIKSVAEMADIAYEQHKKLESFKKNQPFFNQCLGLERAVNHLKDMYNELL